MSGTKHQKEATGIRVFIQYRQYIRTSTELVLSFGPLP